MARVISSRTAALARRLGAQALQQPGGGILLGFGRRHNHTGRPGEEVLEVAAAASTSAESAGALKQRLEEAIDGAMARMSEPDWAPFRPGTSYFAPPRPEGAARGLLELVSRSSSMLAPLPMPPRAGISDDEARAMAGGSRGYPCSTYFMDGLFPDEVDEPTWDEDLAEEE